MPEFMLHIRNTVDSQAAWPPEQHQRFLKACERYIAELKGLGALIAAQPLLREGRILSGSPGAWKEVPFNETREVQVGYYHIRARDLEAAIAFAKGNPEFEFSDTARIEVRPIKMHEADTGFVYPTTS
jgi:hypothetical protein